MELNIITLLQVRFVLLELSQALDKGEITFNYNNKRKRVLLLNFPRAAILDFMTLMRYCWEAEVLFCVTIWQH